MSVDKAPFDSKRPIKCAKDKQLFHAFNIPPNETQIEFYLCAKTIQDARKILDESLFAQKKIND